MASGVHAEIFAQGGEHYIQDLCSTNGIAINGRHITQPYLLCNGDRILIGNTEWLYRHRGDTIMAPR